MANYMLNLGFNWDSPLIGTLFGETGPLNVRFLQFALQDGDGKPAWFTRFAPGDIVEFQLYNLTGGDSLQGPVLQIAFGPIAQDGELAAYDPTSLVQLPGGGEPPTTSASGQTVIELGGASSKSGGDSPWGQALYTWTFATSLQFVDAPAASAFELGFWLYMQSRPSNAPPQTRIYASDPEVIVGSGGNQN